MLKTKTLFLVPMLVRRKGTKFVCPPPEADAPRGAVVPPNMLSILPNALRVVSEPTNSSMLCLSLFIKAGPIYETACNHGITNFIEHMAFKGFNSMKKTDLENLLHFHGIKLWSQTFRDMLVLSARCIPDNTVDVLDIYRKFLTEIEMSNSGINYEKYSMCLDLLDADNDAKATLFDYLHASAYQGTPLAQSVWGPSHNLRNFDRVDACNFMLQQFVPENCVLAACGCVTHEDLVSKAMPLLSDISSSQTCDAEDREPCRFTGSQVLYRNDSMLHAHIAIAVEAPGYDTKEYWILMVAKNIIGSWSRGQGRPYAQPSALAENVATGNLCESFESFYIAYRNTGLWGIYFVAKKMNLEDMMYNIQDSWMSLSKMTVKTEVQRGQNAAKLEAANNVYGVVRSCQDIGTQILYKCQRQTLNEIYGKINNVTNMNVRDVVEKYIYDRCPVVAGVGPVENLPDYTRIRAGMYWLRD